jgi:dissimilatory sulfite reductase related protein
MPLFDYGSLSVELDNKGYLLDPLDWSRELAAALAAAAGIDSLTPDHWTAIEFLRQYQQQHGAAPMIRVLCKETGFSLKKIYELFPQGPTKGACKIAGLPRPDSCI